jgi:COP9 signalosome complex subunit 7
MDQSRAINGLAPFIALAKSANSPRAAADLVTQATSAANTYVFAELLEQPNVKALVSNEQYGKFHTLLEIFAWGTLETYEGRLQMAQEYHSHRTNGINVKQPLIYLHFRTFK